MFVKIDEETIINMDAVVSASILFNGYIQSERCEELLHIQDDEENPDWRELSQEEKEELESFKTYKMQINLSGGTRITLNFDNYKLARQKLVKFFLPKDGKVQKEQNNDEHMQLLKKIAILEERNRQLETVIEAYASLKAMNPCTQKRK